MNPPEPPIGCEVVDRLGQRWEHLAGAYDNHYWMRQGDAGGDPESWIRVNEFGPLQLAWIVSDLQTGESREELRPLTWTHPEDFGR